MSELGQNANSLFSKPIRTQVEFGPNDEVEDLVIEADFEDRPDPTIRLYIPKWDARREEEDCEVFAPETRAACQTVKLSKKATAYITLTQSYGGKEQKELFQEPDLWEELERYGGLKEPPMLYILPSQF